MTRARLLLAALAICSVAVLAVPPPAAAQSSGFPEGSWRRACNSQRLVNDHRLSAKCLRRDGSRAERSHLDLNECWRRRVENTDGQLTCEQAARRGGGARDGWEDESRWNDRRPDGRRNGPPVELYEHVDYEGRRLAVNGSMPNLVPYGFNDVASSMRVNRGVWRLCEHVNYQGRCRIFSTDSPNFVPLGANDFFSSIERVQ